jgi:hypothetical protein
MMTEETAMNRPNILNLLRASHDEITVLRRRIAELEPKAHAYDTLAATVRLNVREQGRYDASDVAWQIKQTVERIEAERAAERAAEAVEP